MINWALPGYLWFLAAPVVLVLLWLLVRYRQERRLRLVLEPVLIQRLHTERILPVVVARYGLFLLALVLLTVALARPRWGERLQMFKGRGIAVVIALDAS
ncbi:MAG: hypothetical protein ABIJ93_04340, partial [candidate division WOR-3 bacterium]